VPISWEKSLTSFMLASTLASSWLHLLRSSLKLIWFFFVTDIIFYFVSGEREEISTILLGDLSSFGIYTSMSTSSLLTFSSEELLGSVWPSIRSCMFICLIALLKSAVLSLSRSLVSVWFSNWCFSPFKELSDSSSRSESSLRLSDSESCVCFYFKSNLSSSSRSLSKMMSSAS
jgi:hypothetical protein